MDFAIHPFFYKMTRLEDIHPKYIEVDNQQYNMREYVDYMNSVLDGSIVANKYIKLACKRMKSWFDRDDMYFDVEDVDSRINFIRKLSHTTGQHHGHHFMLLPWQQFVVANVFGWKWKSNNLRVTHNAFIMISRKNGKTALAAALSLASMICDKEFDYEVDIIANNTKQATIAFDHVKNFCDTVDPRGKMFKQYRSEIKVLPLKSKIQVLSSESMGLDGYNSSVVIFDEFHAQRDWNLYNVMKSSQGARANPLMVTLTTAGFLVGDSYPCYSMWQTCKDILNGTKKDDTQFSAIYQLDDNDKWDDENMWTKCSPSLDETVFRSYMRDEINAAKNNTSLETGVRTKLLNQWCQSTDIWLSYDLLYQHSTKMSLVEMSKLPNVSYAYVGVDLSAVSDLSALTVMVESEGKFYFKSFAFVPEDCLSNASINASRYRDWKKHDYIIVTEGNVQDYDVVLNTIKQIDDIIPIAGIYYDTWNAIQFAVNATAEGLPMYPYSQALGNFNRPTKQFELLLKSNRVVIDYNPMVLWCFTNATLKRDFNDNVKPIKGDTKHGKIDTVISMLEALGGYYLDTSNMPAELTAL